VANALQCTSGVSNGPNLPASSCDPNLLTSIEFVGPKTPNPDKLAYPSDMNNFGPAIGFSYNTNLLGESRPTTIRGGYQLTFGGSGRVVGGGGATAAETIIASAPGALLNAGTIFNDFNEYLDLTDIPKLVPIRAEIPPGGTIPIYGQANFSSIDPNFVTPYTQNFNLSVTTNLTRRLTLDMRYIGTNSKKQQSTVNTNTNNVFNNPELFQALELTRRGQNAPFFDLMLAGLNLNSGVTTIPLGGGVNAPVAYGPIGTCVVQPAGSSAPGLGQEGCAANAVMQHGSAHLRRNGTFNDNIANGNYAAVAASLMGNGSTLPGSGNGALQSLPTGLSGVTNRRLLRNGCNRIAAGLYDPALPWNPLAAASSANIPTRCLPEDFMVANPQLGTPTFITNGESSNYHSLQTQVTLRPLYGMSAQGTYTWSRNLGIDGGATNPLDRNADYTLVANHRTHDFRMNGTFELPIGPNKLLFGNSSGILARVIEGWQTSVIFNWSSGAPDSIDGATVWYGNAVPDVVGPFPFKNGKVVWNGDNNASGTFHGGTYFGKPSPFITMDDPQCTNVVNTVDSQGYNLYTAGDCTINALALRNSDGSPGQLVFQTPQPGTRGTLGRNTMEGRGTWSFDANMSKAFRLTEGIQAQLRIDTTNVLNHPVPGNPNFDSQSGNFGLITGNKTGGRAFQGAVRLTF
jgi:hypothetical protein